MIRLTEELMFEKSRMPLIIRPSTNAVTITSFTDTERKFVEDRLLKHGALLFRGFGIRSAEDFDRLLASISSRRMGYSYRSTPRSTVTGNILTATEYPARLEIPLHNENSYQDIWPLKLALCCLVPADEGGETPIADMREVTAALDSDLLSRFGLRKILYTRHFHPGVDLSWQDTFQTESREEVQRYCDDHNIDMLWLKHDVLRTSQISQGVASHPITSEPLFFNQAHLFHVSSLGESAAEAMVSVFGNDMLPRNACFADHTEIDPSDLLSVRNAFSANCLTFKWRAGDMLLLDNMQAAHSRRSYKGARKVIAALLDPSK